MISNIAVLALIRFCLRGAIVVAVFLLLIVTFQELLIFPSLQRGLGHEKGPRAENDSVDFESLQVPTEDGIFVEASRTIEKGSPRGFAIVYHGNADTIESAIGLSHWLNERGFVAYSLEYRGTGRSRGWPSEPLLEQDSLGLWKLMCSRNECDPTRTLVMGYSIGTGPATYIAESIGAKGLMLLAPFTSLPEVVEQMPLYQPLSPFLRTKFPVLERVKKMNGTQVLVLHGGADKVVPVSHAERFEEECEKSGRVTVSIDPMANHFNPLSRQSEAATRWIESWFPLRENSAT